MPPETSGKSKHPSAHAHESSHPGETIECRLAGRQQEDQLNSSAALSLILSLAALAVYIAAFRRTSRQSLEEERDRLLTLLNEDVTWAMVSEAKLQGVRLSTFELPIRVRQEVVAEVDRLMKQTIETTEISRAFAEKIRSHSGLTQADLREYRRSIEKMKPTTLAVAEQHNQIIASFPLWAESSLTANESSTICRI